MTSNNDQVKALQHAILERAETLSNEHIQQGKMTRNKIIEDVREKIKLMEQKELLSAKVRSDREYQRLVQASELRIHAELDRNRWGLVQSVMDNVVLELSHLHQDKEAYLTIFKGLLKHGVSMMHQSPLIASVNSEDISQMSTNWQAIVEECCSADVEVRLSNTPCLCSGGLKLVSESGDVMLDNTFEGIITRRDDALQRLIFERLFSTVSAVGNLFNG